MTTLTPEAILSAFGLLITTGIWMRLGGVIAAAKDHHDRIVRLEAGRFKDA